MARMARTMNASECSESTYTITALLHPPLLRRCRPAKTLSSSTLRVTFPTRDRNPTRPGVSGKSSPTPPPAGYEPPRRFSPPTVLAPTDPTAPPRAPFPAPFVPPPPLLASTPASLRSKSTFSFVIVATCVRFRDSCASTSPMRRAWFRRRSSRVSLCGGSFLVGSLLRRWSRSSLDASSSAA